MRVGECPAAALERLYRRHPVREAPILARLRAAGRDLRRLTPADLAEDRATGVTDQNHIGGSGSVFALAEAVQLRGHHRVLDLGCGLGGSARLLAHRYGCHVDGIDISRQRVREGNRLTRLVDMDHLVYLRRADMLRARVPRRRYDVLWGQSAWSHVVDKAGFIGRWLDALRDGGRIAFEDVYLKRSPRSAGDRRRVARLERDWHSVLISRAEWSRIFETAGTTVGRSRDLTVPLLRYFKRLDASAGRTGAHIPALERRAWRNAIDAAERGLIGYLRLTAVRKSARA
jgi:cyclopropane fatty-acyl-phospholipid synthase-like methyltransferase